MAAKSNDKKEVKVLAKPSWPGPRPRSTPNIYEHIAYSYAAFIPALALLLWLHRMNTPWSIRPSLINTRTTREIWPRKPRLLLTAMQQAPPPRCLYILPAPEQTLTQSCSSCSSIKLGRGAYFRTSMMYEKLWGKLFIFHTDVTFCFPWLFLKSLLRWPHGRSVACFRIKKVHFSFAKSISFYRA